MALYNHILLGTDFTEASYSAAQKALEIAKKTGAKLSLVHAVEGMPVCAYSYVAIAAVEEETHEEAKKRISELGDELGIDPDNQYIIRESSKIALIDTAKQIKADLIIVGSHGKHGFFSQLGSTAAAVLNNAPCDVLVIRPEAS